MPRPEGWKPLSYTTIAIICGKLCLGRGRAEIASEIGVSLDTVTHLRKALCSVGALPVRNMRKLSKEVDEEIQRLVRTTMLSNYHITRRLGLNWTGTVRARRNDYHAELRARGEPVPRCRCGDEFQHVHICPFKGTAAKRLDPLDEKDAAKDLLAGASPRELMRRYSLSKPAAEKLVSDLTPRQREKRWASIAARNLAVRRRNKRAGFDGLESRLAAAIPSNTPSDIRADALSEMYLSVTSGELTEKQALDQARSFVAKAYRSVSDRFSMPSLDAERDGLRFGDMIEDERAFDPFEALDDLVLAP